MPMMSCRFGDFKDLESHLKDILSPEKAVLIIGPGSSKLPQDIYDRCVWSWQNTALELEM